MDSWYELWAYLIPGGVMCGAWIGLDEKRADKYPAQFFAIPLWPVVLPGLLAYHFTRWLKAKAPK